MAAPNCSAHSPAENRPASISAMESARASACQSSLNWAGSGWLKIALPQIEKDLVVRRRLLAPQFARREPHGIEMLGPLALAARARIRQDVSAVAPVYAAAPAPRIAG